MAHPTLCGIVHEDCVAWLARARDDLVGSIVCDPPYGISFMGAAWDGDGAYHEWAKHGFRVLRQGGRIKVFGGSRTYHRVGAALDTAGFTDLHLEAWAYGSGFPRSADVSKGIDRTMGAVRQVVGYKPGVRGADGTGHETVMPGKVVGVKQVRVDVPVTAPTTLGAILWDGWGTTLKPSWEPVLVGLKPR